MGAEDDLCLMASQILDGWQRSNDALVVGDDAVLERYIEIAAYQNAFAGYLNIFDGFPLQYTSWNFAALLFFILLPVLSAGRIKKNMLQSVYIP